MDPDIKLLLVVNNRLIAEEIQGILEESNIFSSMESDNPASSLLNVYFGPNTNETIRLFVNVNDHNKALEVIGKSQYNDLLKGD